MNFGESVTYLANEYGWDVFEHLEDYRDEEAAWVVRKARGERNLHPQKNLKRGRLKPKPERKRAVPKMREHKVTDPEEIKRKLLEFDRQHMPIRRQAEILGYSTFFIGERRRKLGLARSYDNRYVKIRCENLDTGEVTSFPSVACASRCLTSSENTLQAKFLREKTDTVIYKIWKVTKIRGEQKL